MRIITTAAVTAAMLAAGACTAEAPDTRSSSSTASASASASYEHGERTPGSVRDACTAVAGRTLARLGLHGPPRHVFGPDTCNWGDPITSVHHVRRDLRVTVGAVAPTAHGTATEAATRAFGKLRGFEGDREHNRDVKHPVPVRGLGDQAKLARRWSPSLKRTGASVMVRLGNVIVTANMVVETATTRAYARVRPQAELEAGVAAAAQDVLRRLGGTSAAPTPAPSASGGRSEIRRVRDVCDGTHGTARLVSGAAPRDIGPVHSTVADGCAWGEDLVVQVEASAPRTLTGESGTDVARQLMYLTYGKRAKQPPKGAEEAKTDYSKSGVGGGDRATLVVRRANLIVAVECFERASKRQLRRDAVRVAEEVLAEYA